MILRILLLSALFSWCGWSQCSQLIWNPVGGTNGAGAYDCIGVSTSTIQSGAPVAVVDTTNTNTYAGCPSPAITKLTANMMITLKVSNQNTSTATLNLCGLGAGTIQTSSGDTLPAYAIPSGVGQLLIYSGSNWTDVGAAPVALSLCTSVSSSSAVNFVCGTIFPKTTNGASVPIGSVVLFQPNMNSAPTTTLTLPGGSAVNVNRFDGTAAQAGDLKANSWYMLTNYGGAWRLPQTIPVAFTGTMFTGTGSGSYAVGTTSDCGQLTVLAGTYTGATLPNPAPTSACTFIFQNGTTSVQSISNNSLTINGNSSALPLAPNQIAFIWTDYANYRAAVVSQDALGNIPSPGAVLSGVGSSLSGVSAWSGATSGSQVIGVADIAGTHVGLVWPSSDGTTGQFLQVGAQVACSTLVATWPTVPNFTFPTNCRQLSWVNAPTIGTPTVGQAACIKSAGPPVTIGYCSTTPTSGTCTCN